MRLHLCSILPLLPFEFGIADNLGRFILERFCWEEAIAFFLNGKEAIAVSQFLQDLFPENADEKLTYRLLAFRFRRGGLPD